MQLAFSHVSKFTGILNTYEVLRGIRPPVKNEEEIIYS